MTVQKRISSRGRTEDGSPNPVDVSVGRRLRIRRINLGMSQTQLAELTGLTFQQVQKYEHGQNRISASRLWDLSQVLRVPVEYFYSGINAEIAAQSPRCLTAEKMPPLNIKAQDPMFGDDAIELITAYNRIANRTAARAVIKLLQAMVHRGVSDSN